MRPRGDHTGEILIELRTAELPLECIVGVLGCFSRPDGYASRRGAQYDMDPARGTGCPLWEVDVP